ncbi:Helix-turn-helix domain-containing protein [Pseudomonas sp. NFACC52]|nr:Helix-turn-helix domain-containing protein [Pseudomonas sp. NFACC56-3]SFK63125.1 Helix-turn-helix domain-containing protein [Pseudomonas sp. NFACC52]
MATFSAFHFHRQFTAFVGVPVSRYVQLMRLRRVAHRLAALADHSILDAALGAGFESPEAFCRAFRRAFGMTPSAFRKEPNWQVWNAVFTIPHFSRNIIMQVRIVEFPEARVAALEHYLPQTSASPSAVRFTRPWRQMNPACKSASFPAVVALWCGTQGHRTTSVKRSIRFTATGCLPVGRNCETIHCSSTT